MNLNSYIPNLFSIFSLQSITLIQYPASPCYQCAPVYMLRRVTSIVTPQMSAMQTHSRFMFSATSQYVVSSRPRCTALYCTALYCTVLYCTVLYCTVLYCTAQYCTVLHCITLLCTLLHCITLHCTALYCTALHYTALHCTVPQCFALHCTALHCAALHCTVLIYCITCRLVSVLPFFI